MSVKIAINGLGRIGRCVLRAIGEYGNGDFDLVAVNGPAPTPTHLHLLKHDSAHGAFRGDIKADGDNLIIDGKKIPVLHERDPAKIDWKKYGADIVLECTGHFKTVAECQPHLASGAKKVIISSPSTDAEATIVMGANQQALKPEHKIISVGSCTTNGLAPVAKALNDAVGIFSGFMTTIHAYTADQNIVDGTHKDLRRARAAGLSMVPTSTGAAKTIGIVLPELAGKLDGIAIRVPTPNVSMVDLTFTALRDTSAAEINDILCAAAEGPMKGFLAICDEPLVSIDFNHHPASSVVDTLQTFVINKRMVRIAAWYDNEWGFSCRMLDVARLAANG